MGTPAVASTGAVGCLASMPSGGWSLLLEDCKSRCSLGLEDGFQVGLCKPEEGDLVGDPAKLRRTLCSTGLEVGGVHRGERPSWHGSASSLTTFTAARVRGSAADCLEACSTGLEVGGVHRGDRPS